jgi:hypothetical protein
MASAPSPAGSLLLALGIGWAACAGTARAEDLRITWDPELVGRADQGAYERQLTEIVRDARARATAGLGMPLTRPPAIRVHARAGFEREFGRDAAQVDAARFVDDVIHVNGGARLDDRFAGLIVHEMAHAVLHPPGAAGSIPPWLEEGLADRLSWQRRGMDDLAPNQVAELKQAAEQRRLIPLPAVRELSRFDYLRSCAAVLFLERKVGREKVLAVVRGHPRRGAVRARPEARDRLVTRRPRAGIPGLGGPALSGLPVVESAVRETPMRRLIPSCLPVLVLALSACGGTSTPGGRKVGAEAFVSQPPGGGAAVDGTAGGAPTGAPRAPAPSSAPTTEARAVEESDVYVLSGATLHVLNGFRGLQTVDLADLAAPALLSRVPVAGEPVELYVRAGVAFFVVRDAFAWYWATGADAVAPSARSQLWAVDVSRPGAPAVLARLDVEGSVTDTRLVGDVLYVVSRKSSWQDVLPVPGGGVTGTASGPVGDLAFVASFDLSDPRAPRAVARVDFPATGWESHALVTDERIVLAQSGWSPAGEVTRFTFVDVSDPGGALGVGASFEASGRIGDRWGLDHDPASAVFRAVLQAGWNGGATLRTWTSSSPREAIPLGRLDLVVPETLTAARFDGARVYVVTAERVDPLWVVDASDPARPVLSGQLHLPGQIEFIEPRGGRLLALGHTGEAGQPWQLAVSLVDVTSAATPTLLQRVLVGTGSGSVAASPDDLRKAFRVLDEAGLLLVPYQGWEAASWRWVGGVQLVDFDLAAGSLTKRGFAPHRGAISRAFPLPGRPGWVGALSDERLELLDASDRDAPAARAGLDLARPVAELAFVGGRAVELSGDWWRGDTALVVAPALDPDAATPLARLEVAAPQARMFRLADVVWLVAHDWIQGKAWLEAVDLADPVRPVRRGRLALDPDEAPGATGWGFLGAGDEAVLLGHVLAVHRGWSGPVLPGAVGGAPALAPGGGPAAPADAVLLFDLSNPDAPRRAGRVELASDWSWGLRAEAGLLWLTHHEWTSEARGSVRFYLDRIDVSDPDAPRLLPKVNVPGILLGAADGGRRLYTLEASWDATGQAASTALHALDLTTRDTACLAGTVTLPGWTAGAVLGADFAWAVTQSWTGGRLDVRLTAVELASMRASPAQGVDAGWAWPLRSAAGKLFLAASSNVGPAVLVYDLAAPAAPRFEQAAPTQGFTWDVVVENGVAYLPGGPWGVAMIPLTR